MHQGTSARTLHLRKNQRALRYNSPDCPVKHQTVSGVTPDCPVSHRTVRCASGATATSRQWSTATALNALQCAPESEHAQKGHRTVYRTYPVHHRTTQRPHHSELQRSNPNGRVTWLAHRTVRCAMRQTASQRPLLVVGAINTPTTPHSKHPSFPPSTHYKNYSIQF